MSPRDADPGGRTRLPALAGLVSLVAIAASAVIAPPRRGDGEDDEVQEGPTIDPADLQARVRVETARSGSLPVRLRAFGLVAPRGDEPTAVTAPQVGRVARVEVREGQAVKAGDPLVVLDDRPLQEALAKARAVVRAGELDFARARDFEQAAEQAELDLAIAQAEAAARAARAEAERQAALLVENLASERTATEARQAAEAAERVAKGATEKARVFRESGREAELTRLEAVVEAARIDVRTVEREIEWSVIRSPRDGSVCAPPIAVGRWVEAGTAVAQVVGEPTFAVAIQLTTTDAGSVAAEAAAHVTLPSGRIVAGTVRLVGRAVDPETGLVPVEIVGVDPGGGPRLGEACYVEIDAGAAVRGVLLPASALSLVEDSASVVTVDERDIAHVIPVRLLARSADHVVVEGEGLREGMRVAVDGNFNLPDGAHVAPESLR